MNFEKSQLYHIFNQGNNRQRIFFKEENYLFFIEKMRDYLLPYCDVLAWCLLPNHFHWMVQVKEVEVLVTPNETHPMTQSHRMNAQPPGNLVKYRDLNHSIAILLRSYTRAIQKQENITGTLFRQKTKAECLNEPSGLTPSFYNTRQGTLIHMDKPAKAYPQVCFNYIHQNPVKARLVKHPEDWEFSSYRDLVGLRNGTLINRELIKELELFTLPYSSDDFESSDE
jgi:putative transposase